MDKVNPKHYRRYSTETIDMIRKIWGDEATAIHCEITAFEYRMRAGHKSSETIEEDFSKEEWYLNKAKELRQ